MKNPRLFPVLLIVLSVIACYANTLFAPFIFDDLSAIVDSKAVHSLSLIRVFHHYPHRFLGYYTFSINYAIHGLHVTGYRRRCGALRGVPMGRPYRRRYRMECR